MRICDNGVGFEEENVKRGNGLRNMRMRVKRIGGEILIHVENGVCIEIKTRPL